MFMIIRVSAELTNAMRQSARASARLVKVVKSPDQGYHPTATKSWLAAQQRWRGVWRTMSNPLPVADERNNPRNGESAEEQ
jgi:hypothetical protein